MNDKEYLKNMGRELAKNLPDNHGFILLTFPFGDDAARRIAYMSNAQRPDAINCLKEFLIKASGPEEWLKHIK
jgi:hypothetical protein